MIKFNCPHCDQHIAAELSDAGAATQCPSCGGEIVIPAASNEVVEQTAVSEDSADPPAPPSGEQIHSKKEALVGRGNSRMPKLVVAAVLALLVAVGAFVGVRMLGGEEEERRPIVNTEDDTEEAASPEEDPNNPTTAIEQTLLGTKYLNGEEVPQDFEEALKWFRKAADQGEVFAQNQLGLMYLRGDGVDRNFEEGARWLQLSADQRLDDSQYRLGVLYSTGTGVSQDNVLAYMWLNLAASNSGNDSWVSQEAQSLRENLKKKMSLEEVRKAQALSREWKPNQKK